MDSRPQESPLGDRQPATERAGAGVPSERSTPPARGRIGRSPTGRTAPEEAGWGADERSFVEEWAADFRFNRYRNYPLVCRADAVRVLADSVLETGPEATFLWRRKAREPVGLLRIAPLPWDSAIYGRRMGRITHLCGDLPAAAIRALVRKAPFDHLAARADASDVETQRALTRAGFYPVDSILTYLYEPTFGPPPEPDRAGRRRPFLYREYAPSDRERIIQLTARTYAGYASRYRADPWLRDRSVDRYVRWAEKYVDGDADRIWVSELEGRVEGFLAFRLDRSLLRSTGIGCFGSGLGASRAGGYHGLLRHAFMHTKDPPWQCAEADTQIDNYAVQRIYQDLKLRYVRAEHTFHLRLS